MYPTGAILIKHSGLLTLIDTIHNNQRMSIFINNYLKAPNTSVQGSIN